MKSHHNDAYGLLLPELVFLLTSIMYVYKVHLIIVPVLFISTHFCLFGRGVIAKVEECSHPVVMKGLCAECGQDLTQ